MRPEAWFLLGIVVGVGGTLLGLAWRRLNEQPLRSSCADITPAIRRDRERMRRSRAAPRRWGA